VRDDERSDAVAKGRGPVREVVRLTAHPHPVDRGSRRALAPARVVAVPQQAGEVHPHGKG
jgi:hypothetical protein